jgi:hypothetical protein
MVLPRRWTAIVLAVVAAVLALTHLGLWSLLFAVLLVAVAVAPDARGRSSWLLDVLAWLPLSSVLLLVLALVVALPAGIAGIQLWSGSAAVVAWISLLVVIALVGVLRAGRISLCTGWSVVAWAPALLLAVAQVFRFSQPFSYWSRPVWNGTDWMNHADMVIDLRNRGLLDYALPTPNSGDVPDIYPRALHGLIAWVSQVIGVAPTAADMWESTLFALSVVMAGITVLALAGAALMGLAVVVQLGGSRWLMLVTPLATSLAFGFPTVYGMLFWSGFVTTAAVVVALFALVLLAFSGSERRGFAMRLSLSLLLTLAVFNLWQLMALPFVAVDAYLAWRWWRSGRGHMVLVATSFAMGVAGCIPLGVHTFTAFAVQHVNVDGGFAQFPIGFTLVACLVPVVVVWLGARTRPMPPMAVVIALSVLSTLALGLALVAYTSTPLEAISYYPAKVLWHATVLALPAFVASLGYLVHRVWSARWFSVRGATGRILRLVVVVAPATLLVAYYGGTVSYYLGQSLPDVPSAGGVSPQVPMVIADSPALLGALGRPVMIWKIHPQGWQFWARFEDSHSTQIARSMGHPVPSLDWLANHQVPAACAWLRMHPDAVRVTGPRHGEKDLLAGGCPADVVRPDAWQVVVTPPAWWVGTSWEATGGAPDPNLGELGDLRTPLTGPSADTSAISAP